MRIVKMSGAGNDFVVLGPGEARALGDDLAAWVRRVCRRGLSVGADGVLVVEPLGPGEAKVRFYNPDGVAAFCGNGSRCAARFAFLHGICGESMVLDTEAGSIEARVDGERVRLVLPPPCDGGLLDLEVGNRTLAGRRILAGVPHFVVWVSGLAEAPLGAWGPVLRRHPQFGPEGTNVDLAETGPDGSVSVRTWERGVEGETLSCGSGAVAVALAARLGRHDGPSVRILPRSGVALSVTLTGSAPRFDRAILEGDARVIFEGELAPDAVSGFPP